MSEETTDNFPKAPKRLSMTLEVKYLGSLTRSIDSARTNMENIPSSSYSLAGSSVYLFCGMLGVHSPGGGNKYVPVYGNPPSAACPAKGQGSTQIL